MRQIRDEADRLLEQHKSLSLPYGWIPVGGAHIDPMIHACAREALLSALNRGSTIDEAVQAWKGRSEIGRFKSGIPAEKIIRFTRAESAIMSALGTYWTKIEGD